MHLEKEIETEQHIVEKYEARRIQADARINADQNLVHELLEAAKSTDMDVRREITKELRAVRKDMDTSKAELTNIKTEELKRRKHLQDLISERQHAADEHTQHMSIIQSIDARLKEEENHHDVTIKTQDYLKRRSHVLHIDDELELVFALRDPVVQQVGHLERESRAVDAAACRRGRCRREHF